MIDKYIAELLKTNTRVIIPDFGAFMVKTTPGSSEKQISFNDFLKYNDGLLVNHIAKTESINKDEALKKVKAFVEDIQKELKTNKPFKVEGLGYLFKDPRGSIKFKSGEDKPSEDKPADAKPKVEQSTPPAKTEVKLDEKKEPTPVKKADTTVKKEPEKDSTTPKPATGDSKTLNEKLSDNKKPASTSATNDTKTQVRSGVPDAKKAATPTSTTSGTQAKKPVTSQTPSKKNNATPIIIVAAIVVVLGTAGFLAYLNWDTVKTWLPESWLGKDEPKEVVVDKEALKREQARKDSLHQVQLIQDSIKQAKQDSIRKAQELKMKNQKKYYLVAGSFKTQKYAEKFVEKLKSEGYNAEVFMERHGFFRVSYNSYIDRQQAFNEYRRMKNQNIQVWVLRH